MNGFGGRLRDAMLAAGIETPEQLAKVCGVNPHSAERYITLETADLSAETAFRVARALNVRVGWLIHGELPVRFTPEMLEAAEVIGALSPSATRKWLAQGRSLIRRAT